jgi:phosphate:Na+ symporter
LSNFTDWGFFSRLFFVFVGTLVTIIVQSSSAAMAITLTLCAQGILPFDVAAAMILGENIGTTITAELASMVGNTNAKRSARIHSMFNIIGVTWMVILLPFVLPVLSSVAMNLFGIADPYTNPEDMPIALSAFHTFFNLSNVLLMLAFVPWLVKVAIKTVPKKEGEDDIDTLKFINIMNRTPELATVELQQEVARYGEITTKMLGFSKSLINSLDDKHSLTLITKMKRYEDITDKFEIAITEYVTALSDQEMTHKTSVRLRSFQLAKTIQSKIDRKIYFTVEQREQLNELLEIVERAFKEMNHNLQLTSYDDVTLHKSYELEDEINVQRNAMRNMNETNLSKPDYNVNSAMVFTNIFSSLERVGDHIVNINESVAGEI